MSPITTHGAWNSSTWTEYYRLQWAQPTTEALALFILGVLWLGKFPNINEDMSLIYRKPWDVGRCECFCDMTLSLAQFALIRDINGYVQCDTLGGQKTPSNHGQSKYPTDVTYACTGSPWYTTVSLQTYCYEMKVIEAFSWMNFVLRNYSFPLNVPTLIFPQLRSSSLSW